MRQVMHFDLAGLNKTLAESKEQLEQPDVWSDTARAASINKKIRQTENKLNAYASLERKFNDAKTLLELSLEMDDADSLTEAESESDALASSVAELRLAALMHGPYDANNAILSLHAGAGGTEAQDWVSMLYRMYTRYCERRGFGLTVLDYLEGDEAGIKSVTFLVSGDNAYGYLKAEKGVHRLVRISPFDANKRRHTSFASLDVMPEIDDDVEVEINDDDLRVDTYRSSGAGGQKVNKTSSAIRITHLPTNIVVQCQNERSQLQNRETAMRMLKSKLLERAEEERQAQMAEISGDMKKIEWGSQIRSYVFQPYTLVKDHRTGFEAGNITAVMDGEISGFINAYLIMSK